VHHQTVIGQEAKEQMKLAGEYPDEYFAGRLEDFEYPSERVAESLRNLPRVAL